MDDPTPATDRPAEREEIWPSRLELLGQLASGLAHEIKNPLSTIRLNLTLMAEDWKDAEGEREQRTLRKIGIIQGEAARLQHILDEFLNFARESKLDLELVDPNRLVNDLLRFVEPELTQAKILLRVSLAPNLPQIALDRTKIRQALLNLIINARQAMEEQGMGELFVNTARDGDVVEISVTDTGNGIPPAVRDKVFQVFTSTKKGGTGLGLPTALRIAEEHGGTIILSTETGMGTQFRLRLPVNR